MWRVHWGNFRSMGKLGSMDIRAWHLQARRDRGETLGVVGRVGFSVPGKEGSRWRAQLNDQGLRKNQEGWAENSTFRKQPDGVGWCVSSLEGQERWRSRGCWGRLWAACVGAGMEDMGIQKGRSMVLGESTVVWLNEIL